MSCFKGIFASLPGVSCDQFAGANLSSDQFFLSHCHTDHMVGLEQLCRQLKHRNAVRVNHRIYCSIISKAFIVRKFPFLDERFVKDLSPDAATVVDVFDKADKSMYKLRVTGIPANHCPGSVMFLLEKLDNGGTVTHRILYTGDFRLEDRPLQSIRSLHVDDDDVTPLALDELFLDTTFCTPQYLTFPPRKAAVDKIWQLVHGWVRKNGMYRNQRAKHVVLLHLPAQYGSEAILNDIYHKSGLKWRIHVSDNKFQDYLCSDDLADCTDADPRVAQWVHACSWRQRLQPDQPGGPGAAAQQQSSKATRYHQKLPCQQGPFEVCHIRPSAMYFTQERMRDCQDDGLVRRTGEAYYRVCFSSHSSMTELLEFVRHFKPKKLVPCVVPVGMKMEQVLDAFTSVLEPASLDLRDTQELLGCLSSFSDDGVQSSSGSTPDVLKTLSSPSSRKRRNDVSNDDDASQAKRSPLPLEVKVLDAAGATPGSRCDSSDDDSSSSLSELQSRRQLFRRTKSDKANYSMPAVSEASSVPPQQNRRASLPHNLKIPAITITPSSPSPDPNHPDYPEFFEDRLYLETKNMSTSSTEDKDMEVDLDSTLELEEVLALANTEEEKQNCLNFAKAEARRSQLE